MPRARVWADARSDRRAASARGADLPLLTRPLTTDSLVRLQRLVGNRSVTGLLKGGLDPSQVVQRCAQSESGAIVSSFDPSIRLSDDARTTGDGGALTVYLTGSSPFWHREVCLEWFDGVAGGGAHLAAHLTTPDLATRDTMSNIGKQIWSFLPGTEKMKSVVSRHDGSWDPNYRASRTGPDLRRTVRLDEAAKEIKRNLLLGEIGKSFDYDLFNMGVIGDQAKEKNCADWARDVAGEAYI
ncbi:hypothetical protein OCAE111667_22885 [Occultella aeris]|uniref:Uncharacterized protein n=1 Tax=Occultella aeris TaxID=2761496 RepID=A0A7M4DSI1_9MICO|nr:hypothetical protein [Occultella aeris]VZO40425.1 hypothetical protein HALOF300_05129 [Occultella aeris]